MLVTFPIYHVWFNFFLKWWNSIETKISCRLPLTQERVTLWMIIFIFEICLNGLKHSENRAYCRQHANLSNLQQKFLQAAANRLENQNGSNFQWECRDERDFLANFGFRQWNYPFPPLYSSF